MYCMLKKKRHFPNIVSKWQVKAYESSGSGYGGKTTQIENWKDNI